MTGLLQLKVLCVFNNYLVFSAAESILLLCHIPSLQTKYNTILQAHNHALNYASYIHKPSRFHDEFLCRIYFTPECVHHALKVLKIEEYNSSEAVAAEVEYRKKNIKLIIHSRQRIHHHAYPQRAYSINSNVGLYCWKIKLDTVIKMAMSSVVHNAK